MSCEFNTLELARIYESQGYFKDAFEMYQALAKKSCKREGQEDDAEINAGIHRMEVAMENGAMKNDAMENQTAPLENGLESLSRPMPKKTESLLEQWFELLTLEKRLNWVKSMKARVQQRYS